LWSDTSPAGRSCRRARPGRRRPVQPRRGLRRHRRAARSRRRRPGPLRGDHAIVIGEVDRCESPEEPMEPLVYYRRRLGWRLTPWRSPRRSPAGLAAGTAELYRTARRVTGQTVLGARSLASSAARLGSRAAVAVAWACGVVLGVRVW